MNCGQAKTEACEVVGDVLTSVHGDPDSDFLLSLLLFFGDASDLANPTGAVSGETTCIGLVGTGAPPYTTTSCEWLDGTIFDYLNWQPGQPNNVCLSSKGMVRADSRDRAMLPW